MNKNYHTLVKKYHEIEQESTEKEVHDKRIILRRIFPILAAYNINPAKIKNGEKAFKLFGKLRDIQVQILKLQNIDQTQEIIEYLTFLKGIELKLQNKVRKFCKSTKLVFPSVKKKLKIDKFKMFKKTVKSFNKLIERIETHSIDDAQDIHKVRIIFKKFRYVIEILSYIKDIDEAKLKKLKIHQDKLGEIQDYEVLIKGITKFYKKRNPKIELDIETFEKDQNLLIENFDNNIEIFIADCKDVIYLNENFDSDNNNLIDLKTVEVNHAVEMDSSKNKSTNLINDIKNIVKDITTLDHEVTTKIDHKLGTINEN